MKKTSHLLILTVLLIIPVAGPSLSIPDFTIDCELTDNDKVRVSFTIPKHLRVQQIELYRSSSNLNEIPIDMYEYPITKFTISNDDIEASFIDKFVAHNTTYYYMAKIQVENELPISSTLTAK